MAHPVVPPSTDGSEESLRANLVRGAAILRDAGYTLRDNNLFDKEGKKITFTILLNDPADEKLALNWARNLKRLGITVGVHTLDSAHYQQRLSLFDYDVMVGQWFNTVSPGNEQMAYWGSGAADQPGSRNYPGVKNKLIDDLARAIPRATTMDDMIITTHALDRVLLSKNLIVPFFFNKIDYVAFWTQRLKQPKTIPLYGAVLESWWAENLVTPNFSGETSKKLLKPN
jgi:microcin C transport system substrate-binding protein